MISSIILSGFGPLKYQKVRSVSLLHYIALLGDCRSMNSTVEYIIRKLYLPMQGQYMTYPLGSTLRADIIPRMTNKTNTDDIIFTAILVIDWSILKHWSILKDLSLYHKWIMHTLSKKHCIITIISYCVISQWEENLQQL